MTLSFPCSSPGVYRPNTPGEPLFMDNTLKHLLKARLHAAILAFSKAHKISLKGEVVKWDEWSTGLTHDVWLRIDEEQEKNQESTVI